MGLITVILILHLFFGLLIENIRSRSLPLLLGILVFALAAVFTAGFTYNVDWWMYYYLFKYENGSTDFMFPVLTKLFKLLELPYADLYAFLILYPQSREKIYTRAVVVAAVVSVLINYFAISHYRQNGAAVVSVIAESLAVIIMYLACRKDALFPRIMDRNFLKIIMISAVIFVLSYLIMFREIYGLTAFVAFSALFFILFFGLLTVVKEKNCFSVFVYIKSKLRYRDAGVCILFVLLSCYHYFNGEQEDVQLSGLICDPVSIRDPDESESSKKDQLVKPRDPDYPALCGVRTTNPKISGLTRIEQSANFYLGSI